MPLRTAVIGAGHLGRQHARLHANLAAEGRSQFVAVCDVDDETARSVSVERKTDYVSDWRELIGRVDAVSLAVPTASHCEIACGLLEAGVHVLVEKPISRTLEEADRMIHDLDIVQWLVGEEVEVTAIHAVGIAILTNKVDAANARLEFSSGAVANITASRVGTEKIRKMRFFQPHDYVAIDYTTKRASVSSLAPPSADGGWPGVHVKNLDVIDMEPLRAEILAFLEAVRDGLPSPVPGLEGRNALALALRALERIQEHAAHPGVSALGKTTNVR